MVTHSYNAEHDSYPAIGLPSSGGVSGFGCTTWIAPELDLGREARPYAWYEHGLSPM